MRGRVDFAVHAAAAAPLTMVEKRAPVAGTKVSRLQETLVSGSLPNTNHDTDMMIISTDPNINITIN